MTISRSRSLASWAERGVVLGLDGMGPIWSRNLKVGGGADRYRWDEAGTQCLT
jgi:hypothetical protein